METYGGIHDTAHIKDKMLEFGTQKRPFLSFIALLRIGDVVMVSRCVLGVLSMVWLKKV